MTDWNLIKTQFEILGHSPEQICDEHDVSRSVFNSAKKSGEWSAPTTCSSPDHDHEPDEAAENEIDKLAQEALLKNAQHQATLLPTYIEIETSFLTRLKQVVSDFGDAEEAKKIAETLSLIKPAIMKHADIDGSNAGGNRIMIVNQYPVPQPGDDGYIAPNAVLIGEAAGRGTGFEVVEIPEFEEMN